MPDQWIAGTVEENRSWTDQLYSLRIAADGVQFVSGQFARLALDIEGERVARPYSFVNPPGEEVHEFYSILVEEGLLSKRLHMLSPGITSGFPLGESGSSCCRRYQKVLTYGCSPREPELAPICLF